MKIIFSLALLLLTFSARGADEPLQDGDIIFHTSRSAQSLAIQQATKSKYSHMGIVFFNKTKPFVLEAADPVKSTALEQWIARGEGGHYVVKRLKDSNHVQISELRSTLRNAAMEFMGKPYDLTFEWSDDRIYCSELVWKVYKRALNIELGQVQKLGDFDLSSPTVKQKLKERYGESIPLNETVISPQAIFDSDKLEVVRDL